MGYQLLAWLSGALMNPFAHKTSDVQARTRDENLNRGNSARLLPLIAAIGCPMSFLLEIPALTERWPTHAPRSPLLDVALIFSIISGFMANIFLISRYLEYRPQLSTLSAIGSLTLHDFLNLLILIHVTIQTHRHSEALPESVCMMVASSIVSTICNMALIMDYVRVDNFRAKGSGLTTKQRTLAIVAMCLLLYIAFGAMVFRFLETHRSLTFSQAIYFSVCTVTTVGFGDIIPTRTITRIFTFFYAIVGIVLLALTVSTSRDTIIEGFESLYHSRRLAITQTIREKRLQVSSNKFQAQEASTEVYDQIIPGNHLEDEPSKNNRPFGLKSSSLFWPFNSNTSRSRNSSHRVNGRQADPLKQFHDQLLKEETMELYTRVVIATFLFSCFWLLGGVVFKFTEGWSYGDALYFGYVAFLTLGYGDYTPKSPGGRAFFIAWSLLGIGNMTLLLAVITQVWEVRYKRAISKSRKRKLALTREATTQHLDVDVERKPTDHSIEERENIDVSEILDQLLETAQEFSKHAHYWMNGNKGVAPARLIQMVQEAENIEGLERITHKGGLIETVTSQDRRRLLFVISFARSFETLTKQVHQVKAAIQANSEQLNSLQNLISKHECPSARIVHEAPNSLNSLNTSYSKFESPSALTFSVNSSSSNSTSFSASAVRNEISVVAPQDYSQCSTTLPQPALVLSNCSQRNHVEKIDHTV